MAISLDSKLPSGSWTLYFHSPDENKWDMSTFIKVGTSSTWREFHALYDKLTLRAVGEGMFFFMRDPIPPLWENAKNIRGGSYSFRTQRAESGDAFMNTAIACVFDKAMKDDSNRIHGISISPKKGFNIIKIWNTDSTKFKTPSDMNMFIDSVKVEEVMYTPFLEKKM